MEYPKLTPEEEKAKTAILAECGKLAAAGITFVAVHFDGSGDDGVTEDVRCYGVDDYGDEEHEPVAYDASHLQNDFETFVPFGYDNGCGGFGDVILDVRSRTIRVVTNERFEDYSTSSFEV